MRGGPNLVKRPSVSVKARGPKRGKKQKQSVPGTGPVLAVMAVLTIWAPALLLLWFVLGIVVFAVVALKK